MGKRIYALFACIPMILSACAEKPQESEPQAETTEQTTETKYEIYYLEPDPNLPFKIIKPERLTNSSVEKLFIDDVFLTKRNGRDLIVVYYKFQNCWLSYPASFSDTYVDNVFINGIQLHKDYGEFEASEAETSSKLLPMSSAYIFAGYRIKDLESVKDKEFKVIVTAFNDEAKGFVMMEIEGKMSDLQYKDIT